MRTIERVDVTQWPDVGSYSSVGDRRIGVSRTFIIVKRMVQILVVLNLWVLALLVLITWPGGEATPDVAADAGPLDDASDPSEPPVFDDLSDSEVADDVELAFCEKLRARYQLRDKFEL